MLRTLQLTSGAAFYLLGASFFVAFVLLQNDAWPRESAVWMQIADLPLAFSALVYAGTSAYAGLRGPRSSRGLAFAIAMPLALVFAAIAAMNFWTA